MLKVHLRRMLFWSAALGGLMWLIAFRTPKVYEARVEIKAGSPQMTIDNAMPIEVRKAMAGVINDLDSDAGILRSQRIFKEGLEKAAKETGSDSLATVNSLQQLFPMFELEVPPASNNYQPDSVRVVTVKARAFSPKEAAALANNVAYSFSDYRRTTASNAVRSAFDIVNGQAKRAKARLEEIDSKVRTLKSSGGIVDLSTSAQAMTTSVEALRQKRAAVEAELQGQISTAGLLEAQLSSTTKLVKSQSNNIADPANDGLRNLVVQAEAELASLRQIYEDSAPQVVRAKEKLDAAKKQLQAALNAKRTITQGVTEALNPAYLDLQAKAVAARAMVRSLQSQLAPINRSILEYESKMSNLPGVESAYLDLVRNRLVSEEEYQKNQKWANELQVAKDARTNEIVTLAEADFVEAKGPVAPDVKKYVILGVIAGALLGIAYSFARESFRLPIHTSWQLSELTALPVAASIPALPTALARRHALEIKNPTFRPIESFRFMAFSLLSHKDRPNVILFAGVGDQVDSAPGAAEFAVAMSKTGSRTILVDADLRSGRLSKLFNLDGRSGVADILSRTILPGESSDMFVATEHENLTVLPAGTTTSAGLSDVLTSHLEALVGDLRDRADTVVVQCAPVDVFADCSRLAQYVDHCYMVVSAKTTSYRSIPIAQEILEKSGAKFVGIVLTQAAQSEEPFGNSLTYRAKY